MAGDYIISTEAGKYAVEKLAPMIHLSAQFNEVV